MRKCLPINSSTKSMCISNRIVAFWACHQSTAILDWYVSQNLVEATLCVALSCWWNQQRSFIQNPPYGCTYLSNGLKAATPSWDMAQLSKLQHVSMFIADFYEMCLFDAATWGGWGVGAMIEWHQQKNRTCAVAEEKKPVKESSHQPLPLSPVSFMQLNNILSTCVSREDYGMVAILVGGIWAFRITGYHGGTKDVSIAGAAVVVAVLAALAAAASAAAVSISNPNPHPSWYLGSVCEPVSEVDICTGMVDGTGNLGAILGSDVWRAPVGSKLTGMGQYQCLR